MTVHVPERPDPRPAVLIVLHGAGNNGANMLPFFRGIGERLGMAVLCPDAQLIEDVSANLDVSGIFAKHFHHPRWSFSDDDFPMAALRWALEHLGADPDRSVLAGVSMGGLACWNLAMRLWPQFAAAVPINGALSMWETFGSDRRTRFLLPNMLALPAFVIHGAMDRRVAPRFDQESVAQLRVAGHQQLTYVEVPDGDHPLGTLHFEDDGELVARLETWLAGRRRKTDLAHVRHRTLDDQHGRAHWIGLAGVGHTGAEVVADRAADDAFDLQVVGAQEVQVYLTGDRLDPGQSVRVTVNGETSTVRFLPTVDTVFRTHHRHLDPALTAEAVVTMDVPGRQEPPVGNSEEESRRHADTI
jgi:predicted esterase